MVYPSTVSGTVTAPPNKSYTHRAVAIASLIPERSKISNPLLSRDTRATINAAKMLGASIEMDEHDLSIVGMERFTCPNDVIDVENSGTTLRIFTALSALVERGYTVLTGDDSIRRRPVQPLLEALNMLGVECWSTRGSGTAPVVVRGGGIRGGRARIIGWESSQYVTSILISSLRAASQVHVEVEGSVGSRPYIDATIKTVEEFGGRIAREGYSSFEVVEQHLRGSTFHVPGDFGAASFMVAAAQLTEGELYIRNLEERLPQADAAIVRYVEMMGGKLNYVNGGLQVRGGRSGLDLTIDLSDSPDLLPVLAVMAANRPAITTLRGVAHARLKESDRVGSIATQLSRLGLSVKELDDGLVVRGSEMIEGDVTLDSYGDHRLFMAFTVLGLACRNGLTVTGAESADVSYPRFLEDLGKCGAILKIV
ncbi:MAG: 3-phosphoshikimate 1-carboxyvinyltransferase [Nitrososphaerota archaeon]